MDKKTKRIVIIGGIITFIIIPLISVLIFSNIYKTPEEPKSIPAEQLPERSDNELLGFIADTKSDQFKDENGQPIIAIVSSKRIDNSWYVVVIRQIDDVDATNPAKVLLKDTGELSLILGPGTEFPPDVTQPLKIPTKVVEELNS